MICITLLSCKKEEGFNELSIDGQWELTSIEKGVLENNSFKKTSTVNAGQLITFDATLSDDGAYSYGPFTITGNDIPAFHNCDATIITNDIGFSFFYYDSVSPLTEDETTTGRFRFFIIRPSTGAPTQRSFPVVKFDGMTVVFYNDFSCETSVYRYTLVKKL